MVYKFFNKTSVGSGFNMHANNECPLDLAMQKLAKELHKPIIKKFKEFIHDLKIMSGVLI